MILSYQSRGEREVWLKPYTDEILLDLARQQARVAVICPGFVADCLETLEEINITNRERFVEAGGRDFHYIPCLNDAPAWGRGLAAIVRTGAERLDVRAPREAQTTEKQRTQKDS